MKTVKVIYSCDLCGAQLEDSAAFVGVDVHVKSKENSLRPVSADKCGRHLCHPCIGDLSGFASRAEQFLNHVPRPQKW